VPSFSHSTEPNNQKRKKKKSMNGISKSTVKTIVLVHGGFADTLVGKTSIKSSKKTAIRSA
jgi:hypothetical protein